MYGTAPNHLYQNIWKLNHKTSDLCEQRNTPAQIWPRTQWKANMRRGDDAHGRECAETWLTVAAFGGCRASAVDEDVVGPGPRTQHRSREHGIVRGLVPMPCPHGKSNDDEREHPENDGNNVKCLRVTVFCIAGAPGRALQLEPVVEVIVRPRGDRRQWSGYISLASDRDL